VQLDPAIDPGERTTPMLACSRRTSLDVAPHRAILTGEPAKGLLLCSIILGTLQERR